MGWTEEQLYYADMNSIRVAYEGRQDLIQTFGAMLGLISPPPPSRLRAPTKTAPTLTADAFDAMFG